MIVVDSSVWIGHLRGNGGPAVEKLKAIADPGDILVGDHILLELLQGARDAKHADLIERALRQFEIRTMLGDALAVEAARIHRGLRERGVTIRKTADLIIATFCIAQGHTLLHDDRDFDPLAEHAGLMVL